MFIELIDVLRCPHAHEESWLVLLSGRIDGRDVMEGVLGCPVCEAEYPVADGVVRFAQRSGSAVAGPSSEEDALRLAALLDLADPRGYAIVTNLWGEAVRDAAQVTPGELLDVHVYCGAFGVTVRSKQ